MATIDLPTRADFTRVESIGQDACMDVLQAKVDDAYRPTLGVYDVRFAINSDLEACWIVSISKASPDAFNVRRHIEAAFKRYNIKAEVLTEW